MATQDTCCSIVPYFKIHEGQLDYFKGLCEEFVSLGEHRWLVGGDIITALDGQPVSNMRGLHTLLSQATAGQQVSLTLLRDGEKVTLTTTLAEYPELDLNSSSLRLRIT